jgi:hypothetical protein
MGNYTNKQVLFPPFVSADVAGVVFGGFAVDKYICSQPDSNAAEGSPNVAHSGAAGAVPALSKAGVPVWDYITFPQAMIAAANKGKGWHLTTAFEWGSLAHLAKKLNTLPNGGNANTDPPADSVATTEIALLDKHLHGENGGWHRALPGTGPKNWAHNHLANGVFDLQGLVWQWVMGLFIGAAGTDGHPEVLASLDCTYTGSPYGRGTISNSGGNPPVLTLDGAGVNWLKQWAADAFNGMSVYIAEAAGGAGAFYAITDTTATTLLLTNGDAPGNGIATFCIVKHVATDIGAGCTSGGLILTLRDADADLKAFAIPATTDGTGATAYGKDIYYFDKAALHAALRGGPFTTEAVAGVFSLNLYGAPSYSDCGVGFRACKAL